MKEVGVAILSMREKCSKDEGTPIPFEALTMLNGNGSPLNPEMKWPDMEPCMEKEEAFTLPIH